jgi:hypothetical protein
MLDIDFCRIFSSICILERYKWRLSKNSDGIIKRS